MLSAFDVRDIGRTGLRAIERSKRGDVRGFFSRFYCRDAFAELGWPEPVAQMNHTFTAQRGAVRGMHFQYPPSAERKLVSCLSGHVFDVAVDLRAGSPTYLQWFSEELSSDNGLSLLIPHGFAHGFQCLTEDCELFYLHSAPYDAAHEGALHPCDPRLAIDWPLEVTQLSERDAAHPLIDSDFKGICL